MLDNRKKEILQAIVEEYIETAEPVSSKAIVEKRGLDYSSATIRNDMAELEKIGLLDKPHTSSGRVPSEKGYRYYVDELVNYNDISIQEIKYIQEQLETKINQIEELTQIATSTLSEITHYTSVGIGPTAQSQDIEEIKFVLLGSRLLMAVILTENGLIKETIIKFDEDINQEQVDTLTYLFNNKLKGEPLAKIDKPMEEYMHSEMNNIIKVVKPVIEQITKVINEDVPVYMEGANKSFEFPEFKSLDIAKNFVNILDTDKTKQMIEILNSGDNQDEINVYIGDENVDKALKDFSVITFKHKEKGKDLGTIAIIGPTRMDYSKVISAMKYISKKLNEKNKLDEGEGDWCMAKEEKMQNEEKCDKKDSQKNIEEVDNKEKEINEKLSKTQDELEEIKDRHTRLIAEFDNLKKRSAKEREGLYNSIISDIITSFLPVIDNLEKAAEAESKDEEYKKGIELVLKQFKDVLKANGVEQIEAVGQPFDPELHEAVSMIQDENLGEKIVATEYRKGYRIGSKVIRHSMVVVAN